MVCKEALDKLPAILVPVVADGLSIAKKYRRAPPFTRQKFSGVPGKVTSHSAQKTAQWLVPFLPSIPLKWACTSKPGRPKSMAHQMLVQAPAAGSAYSF